MLLLTVTHNSTDLYIAEYFLRKFRLKDELQVMVANEECPYVSLLGPCSGLSDLPA